MNITRGQIQETFAQPASTPANPVKNDRASTSSPAAAIVAKNATPAGALPGKSINRSTDVTLRRDNNGRVFYVVSDANSGQEILEVPPKALREVGQGIEDYLKEAQSKATLHVKVKA